MLMVGTTGVFVISALRVSVKLCLYEPTEMLCVTLPTLNHLKCNHQMRITRS